MEHFQESKGLPASFLRLFPFSFTGNQQHWVKLNNNCPTHVTNKTKYNIASLQKTTENSFLQSKTRSLVANAVNSGKNWPIEKVSKKKEQKKYHHIIAATNAFKFVWRMEKVSHAMKSRSSLRSWILKYNLGAGNYLCHLLIDVVQDHL